MLDARIIAVTFLVFHAVVTPAKAQTTDPAPVTIEPETEPLAVEAVHPPPPPSTDGRVAFAPASPPPAPAPTAPMVCDGTPSPCIRVQGQPGLEFWVVNREAFFSWGGTGTIEERIDNASTFLIRHYPTYIARTGSLVPQVNRLNTRYLVIPKCEDKVRYRHHWDGQLPSAGEQRISIGCEA